LLVLIKKKNKNNKNNNFKLKMQKEEIKNTKDVGIVGYTLTGVPTETITSILNNNSEIKFMFVGDQGIGKTSLIESIIGKLGRIPTAWI